MTEIERLKSIFYNEENCLKFLLVNNQIEKCDSCRNEEFYQGSDFMKTYIKICKTCKKKISPKKNTLFENVRFGLVTAFHIYIETKLNIEKISSVEIAERYNITQKTAWEFLNKINTSHLSYNIERYINVEELENEVKLLIAFGY
jgi:hypothetical protein